MAGRNLQNWRRIWLAAINVRLTAAAQAIRKPRYTDWPWFFVPLLMLAIIDYAYLRYWAESEGCKINDKEAQAWPVYLRGEHDLEAGLMVVIAAPRPTGFTDEYDDNPKRYLEQPPRQIHSTGQQGDKDHQA
jgi:hypothetical protein